MFNWLSIFAVLACLSHAVRLGDHESMLNCEHVCAMCMDGSVVRVWRNQSYVGIARDLARRATIKPISAMVSGMTGGISDAVGGVEKMVDGAIAATGIDEMILDKVTEKIGAKAQGKVVNAAHDYMWQKADDKSGDGYAKINTDEYGPDECPGIAFTTDRNAFDHATAFTKRKLGDDYDVSFEGSQWAAAEEVYVHTLDAPGKGRRSTDRNALDLFRKSMGSVESTERSKAGTDTDVSEAFGGGTFGNGMAWMQGQIDSAAASAQTTVNTYTLSHKTLPWMLKAALAGDPLLCGGPHRGLKHAVRAPETALLDKLDAWGSAMNNDDDIQRGDEKLALRESHVECRKLLPEAIRQDDAPVLPAECAEVMEKEWDWGLGCKHLKDKDCTEESKRTVELLQLGSNFGEPVDVYLNPKIRKCCCEHNLKLLER